jgi:hypothetical protein
MQKFVKLQQHEAWFVFSLLIESQVILKEDASSSQ